MFGEFSITVNGKSLSHFKGRTKRVWMLIQYLIANRKENVPLSRLVQDLWNESACGDPKNALKNLVYRARTLLQKLAGNGKYQFIVFENGTYRWNSEIPCVVDAEQFENDCRLCADESLPESERAAVFPEAASLYTGDYLEKSSWCPWAAIQAERYRGMYQKCAEDSCRIFLKQKHFDEAAAVCRTAIKHLPYELSLHCLLLKAYVLAGKRSRAYDHYNHTRDLFYRQFCIDMSDTLLPYYQQLMDGSPQDRASLTSIKGDLREKPGARGAFFCDYDVFRSIYRMQARMATRTGRRVFMVLFTLSSENGAPPQESVGRLAAEKLKNAIISSLRRSDTAAPYSASQFIVLLPSASFEDAQSAASRVEKNFRFNCRYRNIRLDVSFSPLD